MYVVHVQNYIVVGIDMGIHVLETSRNNAFTYTAYCWYRCMYTRNTWKQWLWASTVHLCLASVLTCTTMYAHTKHDRRVSRRWFKQQQTQLYPQTTTKQRRATMVVDAFGGKHEHPMVHSRICIYINIYVSTTIYIYIYVCVCDCVVLCFDI